MKNYIKMFIFHIFLDWIELSNMIVAENFVGITPGWIKYKTSGRNQRHDLVFRKMLALSFIVPLTILSLIALIINATILFIVILCKQVRAFTIKSTTKHFKFNCFVWFCQVSPSNILLFHLGIVESLLSVVFLIFSVPLLAHGDENTTVNAICNANAFFLTLLHPIALWTVCGLNFDRYYCISAPLHYNAIVSSNKVKLKKNMI